MFDIWNLLEGRAGIVYHELYLFIILQGNCYYTDKLTYTNPATFFFYMWFYSSRLACAWKCFLAGWFSLNAAAIKLYYVAMLQGGLAGVHLGSIKQQDPWSWDHMLPGWIFMTAA